MWHVVCLCTGPVSLCPTCILVHCEHTICTIYENADGTPQNPPFSLAAVETGSYRRTIQCSAFVVSPLIVPGGVLLCVFCMCTCVRTSACAGINSAGCMLAGESVRRWLFLDLRRSSLCLCCCCFWARHPRLQLHTHSRLDDNLSTSSSTWVRKHTQKHTSKRQHLGTSVAVGMCCCWQFLWRLSGPRLAHGLWYGSLQAQHGGEDCVWEWGQTTLLAMAGVSAGKSVCQCLRRADASKAFWLDLKQLQVQSPAFIFANEARRSWIIRKVSNNMNELMLKCAAGSKKPQYDGFRGALGQNRKRDVCWHLVARIKATWIKEENH